MISHTIFYDDGTSFFTSWARTYPYQLHIVNAESILYKVNQKKQTFKKGGKPLHNQRHGQLIFKHPIANDEIKHVESSKIQGAERFRTLIREYHIFENKNSPEVIEGLF